MTHAQRFTLLDVLRGLEPFYAHHGDCIGADEEFHDTTFLAQCLKRVIHPPLDNTKRAFCVPARGDVVRPPDEYLVRNQTIVNSSTHMIAAPGQDTEQLRSGTWSTVRQARRAQRPLALVLPNGDAVYERWA